MRSGFVPAYAEPPIPCITLNRWRSEQPGSVTSSVPKKTMDPAAAAIAGSIVGAASIASVAGTALALTNTGSVNNVLEGSVMSVASSCGAGERELASLKFLFYKCVPGHGEIFEEIFMDEPQPGDILLFPLDRSNNVIAQTLFRHAAVYCGDGEVIHFQGMNSKRSPGVTSKEGSVKMQKERGKFKVYRKKDGIVLEDFHHRVKKAMNSEAMYDLYTNNCIHFALSLLGLQEFYSQLVKIQDEGDRSHSEGAISSPPSPSGQGSSHTA